MDLIKIYVISNIYLTTCHIKLSLINDLGLQPIDFVADCWHDSMEDEVRV